MDAELRMFVDGEEVADGVHEVPNGASERGVIHVSQDAQVDVSGYENWSTGRGHSAQQTISPMKLGPGQEIALEMGFFVRWLTGMVRYCPVCGEWLEISKTTWSLSEMITNGHKVACINNYVVGVAAAHRNAVAQQINANLSAYNLDFDAALNLGVRGTAWVQCPQAEGRRGLVNTICLDAQHFPNYPPASQWWV
jgi:hypothetical protein